MPVRKLPTYGKWKRGVIYFQRRIPKKYLNVPPFDKFGKTVEWSTNVSDLGVGLNALSKCITRFEKMLVEAENFTRNGIAKTEPLIESSEVEIQNPTLWLKVLTREKAAKLAVGVFREFLRSYEEIKRNASSDPLLSKAMLKDFEEYEVANYNTEEWLEKLEYEPQKAVRREALSLLLSNGYIEYSLPAGLKGLLQTHPVEDTPEFETFCFLLGKAHLDIKVRLEELKKTRILTIRPTDQELFEANNDKVDPDEVALRNIAERYKKFNSNTTLGWLRQVDRVVYSAADFGVPEDIRAIKRIHIKTFMDDLRNCPANIKQRYPGKTIQEAIELNKKFVHPTLSPNSIKDNWLAPLRAIFNYAIERDIITENPTNNLRIEHAKKNPRKVHFNTDELNNLVHSPWFSGCLADGVGTTLKSGKVMINDHRYWGSLFALFTGARTSEIAQLRVEDCSIQSPIPYVRITTDDERTVKNDNAIRLVPFHSKLIRLGFLDYVSDVKNKHHERVFPLWEKPKDKDYSQSSSQRAFNRQLVPLISQQTNPKPVFHSFRNTFITEMISEEVNSEHRNFLVGHALAGMGEQYVADLKLEKLKSSIEKVQYAGVDFSHLIGTRYSHP